MNPQDCTPEEIEKFLDQVVYEPNTGCWLWGGHHEGMYISRIRTKISPARIALMLNGFPCGRREAYSPRICYNRDPKLSLCINPQHFCFTRDSRFWIFVKKAGPNDCWEWQGGKARWGYGSWNDPIDNKRKISHKVAFEITKGQVPDGMFVLHSCDNPPCCNPNHLFLGTPKDNTQDMVTKRRHLKNGRHPRAKIGLEQVREVRSRIAAGQTIRQIYEEMGLTKSIVEKIAYGETWVGCE